MACRYNAPCAKAQRLSEIPFSEIFTRLDGVSSSGKLAQPQQLAFDPSQPLTNESAMPIRDHHRAAQMSKKSTSRNAAMLATMLSFRNDKRLKTMSSPAFRRSITSSGCSINTNALWHIRTARTANRYRRTCLTTQWVHIVHIHHPEAIQEVKIQAFSIRKHNITYLQAHFQLTQV